MDTQYLIRKVETCPICGGEGQVWNADWARINAENSAWMSANTGDIFTDEALEDWQARIKATWSCSDPPPEDEPCYKCEGEGKIESWISFLEVFTEIAGFGPTGYAHHVWCSCGKSTLAVWNPEAGRYEAQDEGWRFLAKPGAWTCGSTCGDHDQARIDVLDGDARYERMVDTEQD